MQPVSITSPARQDAPSGMPQAAPASTSPPLDMKGIFGPVLRGPSAKNFDEFGQLCEELFNGREEISKGFSNYLFGEESLVDKIQNDTGASVRSILGSVGFDATSWMGAAPERPPPHSQLIIRRGATSSASVGFTPLQKPPSGEPGPQEVPPHLGGYQDGWLSAYHLHTEGEVPEAGLFGQATPESWSDLRISAACGSHPEMVAENLELVDAYRQAFAWLAAEGGDPATFKQAFMDSFPRTMAASGLYLDVPAAQVGRKQMDSGNVRLSLDVPLLPSKAGERFPRLSELMQLFDPCIIVFTHPKTGAEFMEWRLEDRNQHIHFYMKDGYLAYEGGMGTEGPVYWDKDGKFECEVKIECSMVLLDLQSVASIPFPSITMKCDLDNQGHFKIKCVESGDPPLKGVADYFSFDLELFRRLLVEGYEMRLESVQLEEKRSAVRFFWRFMFPSSSTVTLVSQWFQDFVNRQLRELDFLDATGAYFKAMAEDARHLSQGQPPRA